MDMIKRAEQASLLNRQIRPQAISMVVRNDNPDEVILLSNLFPEWDGRPYKSGDPVIYLDKPYSAIHDIIANPTWNPIDAASEWRAYHARSPEFALPFLMRHAEDKYMTGEYVTWTPDEDKPVRIYECLADNVTHNPEERPDVWKVYETVKMEEPIVTELPEVEELPEPEISLWAYSEPDVRQGDIRKHNGIVYECISPGGAGANVWEPHTAPTVWKEVSQ